MDRDVALSKLRAHEAELRRLGVERLYLFGSTARGEARADSDVDLFFDDDGSLGLFDVMAIRDEVTRVLGCPAHLLTRDSINEHYRPWIEPGAVAIFE